MQQIRTFLIYSGTSYLLQAARLISAIVLRSIVDPITVGFINTAQTLSPIFSVLTLGTVNYAIRELPTVKPELRSGFVWGNLIVNTIEAVVIFVPFVFLSSICIASLTTSNIAVVFLIGIFAFGQRVCAVSESMLLAIGVAKMTAVTRFIHIIAIGVVMLSVSKYGVVGYLAVSTMFSIIVIAVIATTNNISDISWVVIRDAFKITPYGGGLAAEKLIYTIATVIDSLFVTATLGPEILAGYALGTSVRGAIGSLANNFNWVLWPQAIRDHRTVGKSKFSDRRFMDAYCLIALTVSIVCWFGLKLIILKHLKTYTGSLDVIGLVVCSTVPILISDWVRIQILVQDKISYLPLITLARIGLFLICFFGFNWYGMTAVKSIAWGSLVSTIFYMIFVTIAVELCSTAKKICWLAVKRTAFAIAAIIVIIIF